MKAQKLSHDRSHSMKNDHESRITRLEVTMESILKTLDRIDRRFDRIEQRLEDLETKMERKFENLDKKVDSNFKWLLGLYIGGCAAILGLMSHGFHWL